MKMQTKMSAIRGKEIRTPVPARHAVLTPPRTILYDIPLYCRAYNIMPKIKKNATTQRDAPIIESNVRANPD